MNRLFFTFVTGLFALCINAAIPLYNNFTTETIHYWSVDSYNDSILLSEFVYFPNASKTLNFIMLNNHPTTTLDKIVPTGAEPQIDQVKYMTSEGALVVCPDYMGFGISVNSVHPYMCHLLTARNVVDGLLAAIERAKEKGFTLSPGYYTDNVGYSQGGGVTLAVHKYLENTASPEVRDMVNLRHSFVGAGAMQMSDIFDQYEQEESMTYPALLPFMMMGLFDTYGETTLRGLKMEDLFTEDFKKMDIFERLKKKNTLVADINAAIISHYGGKCNFYDIMCADFKDKKSAVYRQIHKVLKKNDLLDGSWKPVKPVTLFHYTKDEVVPYSQSVKAVEVLNSSTNSVKLMRGDDYKLSGIWRLTGFVSSMDNTHMGYGTKFYVSYFSEDLRKF